MNPKINTQIENAHEYGIIHDSGEIFLHGFDTEDSGTDHRMAAQFIKNLKILEREFDIITIHQYNIGGSWDAGMAIYDAIKESPCNFIFICYGVAASMGSIIPQSVLDKGYRITYSNCGWLIHEGDLTLEGIPIRARSNLDYIELTNKKMYDIYAQACINADFFQNRNKSHVKAFLRRKIKDKTDWLLNGEEAVYYGFADGVLGTEGWEDVETIKKYFKK